jgi:hypothetical protein
MRPVHQALQAISMKKNLGICLFVAGVLLAPILFWFFGPLLFWPVSRMYLPAGDKRIWHFQNIFFAQLIFVVGGTVLAGLLILFWMPDSLYLLALPYSIGIIFLIVGILVFFLDADAKA